MIRSAIAALVFAVLYGGGIRLYTFIRAGRDTQRWQLRAVAVAAAFGGVGFYAAQQVKSPHLPTLLDIPAFVIMAVAAAAIPAILETTRVLQVRLLRDTKVEAHPTSRVPPDSSSANS